MTTRDIAERRLLSQQLLGTKSRSPRDVVEWLGAVQAQDYTSAKWALGLRLRGATDDDVERAFAKGAVLRTHLLRPTWHFVAPPRYSLVADPHGASRTGGKCIHVSQAGSRYRHLQA